ncbi:unnamed protein product, partial [Mesorhabditis belari]|uniref:Uncharacterized protein n=1 Tax=Mesorhabditis belari TaxID=2138241 RepID=A0AAF3FLR9_9BILA
MSFSNGPNGLPPGGGTGGGRSGNNFHIPTSRESCNSPGPLQGIATPQTQKSMARVQGSAPAVAVANPTTGSSTQSVAPVTAVGPTDSLDCSAEA